MPGIVYSTKEPNVSIYELNVSKGTWDIINSVNEAEQNKIISLTTSYTKSQEVNFKNFIARLKFGNLTTSYVLYLYEEKGVIVQQDVSKLNQNVLKKQKNNLGKIYNDLHQKNQIRDFPESGGTVSLVFRNEQHFKKMRNIPCTTVQMHSSVLQKRDIDQFVNRKPPQKTSIFPRNKQKPLFFPNCIKTPKSVPGSVTQMNDYNIAALNNVFLKKISAEEIIEKINKIPIQCQSGVLNEFMMDLFWATDNTINAEQIIDTEYYFNCDLDLVYNYNLY
jgi:hypothetical protein